MSRFAVAPLLSVPLVAALAALAGPAEAATVTVGPNQEILVDGEPFLPIMQWAQSPSRIAYQKGLGINTFVGNGSSTTTTAEYLDECATQGVWCVQSPSDLSLANHAALLGWIFGDEPDLESHQTEPSALLTQYQSIKASDPNHVTFMTLTARFYSYFDAPTWMGGSKQRYYEYPDATDVIGFDLYPVYGWCRPDWLYMVGDSQDELVSTYAPGKPTYQWIECVRTSSQYCELDERGADDGPFPEEVRNEVWQAIAHGAVAVGYFTHSWECPGYTQFCLTAEQEAELTRTNAQLTALTRPILAPRYAETVDVQATGGARVDLIAKQHDGRVYLFSVNVERESTDVTFDVPGIESGTTVEVVDESRDLQASGTTFGDSFEPLEVHIYAASLPANGGSGGAGVGGSAGGTGGAGATGGSATGGSATGGSATGGTPAAPAPVGADEDEGGCGCSIPGRPDGGGSGWLLMTVIAWARRRQRG